MTVPYQDPTLAVEERTADLLARMSLDEKLAQLGSRYSFELITANSFDEVKAKELIPHGVGQISRIGGASSLNPPGVAKLANAIQRHLQQNTRLGIPAFVHEECVAGYMGAGGTNFPHGIGVGATWDPAVSYQMGRAIARQLREAGAHQGLAPVLDVCRDPRWGRVEETSGEDPYLVASLGDSYIRGLQGGAAAEKVVATAKHFAGHGAPEGGMNSAPPHISPRELRETYLMPFEAGVKVSGVDSFMHAYHEIDGIPCIANKELLVGVLREQWGFAGTMVSDYNGVEEIAVTHRLVASMSDAAATAIDSGVDVELPSTVGYGTPLKHAVESGQVAVAVIDRSVARVLRQKFELGLFEDPFVSEEGTTESEFDRSLALDVARKSLVLLKNEDAVLPVNPDLSRIAVIGPSSDDPRLFLGDYSYVAALDLLREAVDLDHAFVGEMEGAVPRVDLSGVPTVLRAIRDRVPATVEVVHELGCETNSANMSHIPSAIDAAVAADLAVVVLGGRSGMDDASTCGEFRDRTDITLPGVQQQLLDAVAATGTPVVLVILSGRPLSPDVSQVRAVIHAWLPGDAGGVAIAGALFGDFSPGGKLPITVPRSVGQIPIYHGHKPTGGRSRLKGDYVDSSCQPLFGFGFGLSYSTFELSDIVVEQTQVPTDGSVRLDVTVANMGEMMADEVVQIYARREAASLTRPVRELVGFKRVGLEPGGEARISFVMPCDLFGFVGRGMSFQVEPGEVQLLVGTQALEGLEARSVTLTGETILDPERSFFSAVAVI